MEWVAEDVSNQRRLRRLFLLVVHRTLDRNNPKEGLSEVNDLFVLSENLNNHPTKLTEDFGKDFHTFKDANDGVGIDEAADRDEW